MRQESKQRNAPSSPPLRGALASNVVGGRPCELASLRHAGPHNSAVNALRSAAHQGRGHRARGWGGAGFSLLWAGANVKKTSVSGGAGWGLYGPASFSEIGLCL